MPALGGRTPWELWGRVTMISSGTVGRDRKVAYRGPFFGVAVRGGRPMIMYAETAETLTAQQLSSFFVGWPHPPTPETHLLLLEGSDEVVIAQDDATGQVVGFITAITDGVLSAYIPLLEE